MKIEKTKEEIIKEMEAKGIENVGNQSIGLYAKFQGYEKVAKLVTTYTKEVADE